MESLHIFHIGDEMKIKAILGSILICGISIYLFNDREKVERLKPSEDYYNEIVPVEKNVSFLKKDDRYLYLNKDIKNEVSYKKITKLSKSYLKVFKDKEYLIDNQNRYIELPEFETIESISEDRFLLLKKDKKFFYYDLDKKQIITALYDGLGSFKENRAHFIRDEKLGFLDENGKEIVGNIYSAVGEFTEGYAIVVNSEDKKYSVIDRFGNEILKECDFVKIYSDNEFILKRDKKYIVKTKHGEFETEDNITRIKSGFYIVSKENTHKIFSSEKQETIKELEGEYLGVSKDTLLIKLKEEVLAYNFITGKDRVLKYDDIKKYEKDYIIGAQNEKIYLILNDGKTISKGMDLIYPKAFKMFIVGEEMGYGVLNENGERVLESRYDGVQLIPQYIIVEENEKKGIFNKYGEKVLDTQYKDIQYIDENIYTLDENGWRYILLN